MTQVLPIPELTPDSVNQLVNVLSQLTSTDNSLRTAAENELNDTWVRQKPHVLLSALANLIHSSPEAAVSKMNI